MLFFEIIFIFDLKGIKLFKKLMVSKNFLFVSIGVLMVANGVLVQSQTQQAVLRFVCPRER